MYVPKKLLESTNLIRKKDANLAEKRSGEFSNLEVVLHDLKLQEKSNCTAKNKFNDAVDLIKRRQTSKLNAYKYRKKALDTLHDYFSALNCLEKLKHKDINPLINLFKGQQGSKAYKNFLISIIDKNTSLAGGCKGFINELNTVLERSLL